MGLFIKTFRDLLSSEKLNLHGRLLLVSRKWNYMSTTYYMKEKKSSEPRTFETVFSDIFEKIYSTYKLCEHLGSSLFFLFFPLSVSSLLLEKGIFLIHSSLPFIHTTAAKKSSSGVGLFFADKNHFQWCVKNQVLSFLILSLFLFLRSYPLLNS